MKESKLEKCPFCGGNKVTIVDGSDVGDFCMRAIECSTCHARGPEQFHETMATRLWNIREKGGDE